MNTDFSHNETNGSHMNKLGSPDRIFLRALRRCLNSAERPSLALECWMSPEYLPFRLSWFFFPG